MTQPVFATSLRHYGEDKKGKVPFNLIPCNPKKDSPLTSLPPLKKPLAHKGEEEGNGSEEENVKVEKAKNSKETYVTSFNYIASHLADSLNILSD